MGEYSALESYAIKNYNRLWVLRLAQNSALRLYVWHWAQIAANKKFASTFPRVSTDQFYIVMGKKKNKQVRISYPYMRCLLICVRFYVHGVGTARGSLRMKRVCIATLVDRPDPDLSPVLMQHQKAKHFKCSMCPRRLNTAGGLAVHIQQVHKLEPEKYALFQSHIRLINTHIYSLPRIENALPGRDGYEVEIFGMVGIPAPDVADYKRRKEIELGLSAGSISQPPQKKAKTENKVFSEDELKAQLEIHKALMGVSTAPENPPPGESSAVYNAAPQAYAAAPVPAPVPPLGAHPPVPMPSPFPPGATPPIPLGVSPSPGLIPPFPPPMPGMPPG